MSTAATATPQSLADLASAALHQGVEQLKAAGPPLHPFFLDEDRSAFFLVDNAGRTDPMTMALDAIPQHAPQIRQCALVIDSRIGFHDGKKWDAIVVMACERDAGNGVVLAQRYVPKGLFRKFRLEGEPERIGEARNFIDAALEGGQ